MKSKEKCCFVFRNGRIGEKFAEELQKRLGVVTKGDYSYAGYAIYVDRTVYRRALQIGNKMLLSSNKFYTIAVRGWVDHYDEVQWANMGLIMYGFPPSGRKVSADWRFEEPSDIAEFKKQLSDFLGKEVHLTYNCTDNAVSVLVAPMNEHQSIKREVKNFLKTHETPFERIRFFNYVGKLI